MNYPSDINEKLGFDQIIQHIINLCNGPIGVMYAQKIKFNTNFKLLEHWLLQVLECKQLLEIEDPFPTQHYYDNSNAFKKLEIEGYVLSLEEIFKIKLTNVLAKEISHFIQLRSEKYPTLFSSIQELRSLSALDVIIDMILDINGHIKNNASKNYEKIISEIGQTELELNKKIKNIFNKAKHEGYTAETDISIRNGRLVLPIIAEYKKKIKGLVHDESATGKIIYIEPIELVEHNNKLKALYIEKQREVEKILKEITLKIVPFLPDLVVMQQKIGLMDFIMAKGKYAIKINASLPKLSLDPIIVLKKAYHPLLQQSLHKQGKQMIPIDVELNQQTKILVISGPNAGGKSITLKTIALLQLMLQSGILIPCNPDSQLGIFKDILIDIGDGQSIDNNLSSYSSHLTAMKYFTNFAGSKSLFFIDELGSGTDPQFGGPMGEAILETLAKKHAWGIVTTHFSNIKTYASQKPTFANASMAYDIDQLVPLYQLVQGKPGSSFAYEVAGKIGLNKHLIDLAKSKTDHKQQHFDELIIDLQKEKIKLEQALITAETETIKAKQLKTELDSLKKELDTQKKDIINNAKIEAKHIINSANKAIENTIKDIKESGGDNEKIKTVRQKLKTDTEVLTHATIPKKVNTNLDLEIGQMVKIHGYDQVGKIVIIEKNYVLVEIGLIKTKVTIDKLSKCEDYVMPIPKKMLKGYDYVQKQNDFNPRLDVRGMRTEEALKLVTSTLDDALILGADKLWILHGKGDGILRKQIRQFLKPISHIKSIENEHVDFGGDGISIISLA